MAKKKEAHHGGAWKVAYADFVTAMMALFMVLWISAQDKKILVATARYFQSPFKSPFEDHSGLMPFNKELQNSSAQAGKGDEGTGSNRPTDSTNQIQLQFLNSVAADFYRMVNLDKSTDQKAIDVQVTSDGLLITLFDRAKRAVFVGNSCEFTEWGRFMMQNLAWLIDRYQLRVAIDGHTRANLDLHEEKFTAWELSTDRANAARRTLVYYALDPRKIERVTGYADTRPLKGERADSDSNQRITLSLALSNKSRLGSGPDPRPPLPPPPTASSSP
jgi:chemotaxis protein MotB